MLRGVGELAQREPGCTISTCRGHEGVKVGRQDALDEAKTAHARQFLGHIARLDIGPKGCAIHAFAGSVDTSGAIQTVNGLSEATRHIHADALSAEFDLGLRVALCFVMFPQGSGTRQAEQEQEEQARQGRFQTCAQRGTGIHVVPASQQGAKAQTAIAGGGAGRAAFCECSHFFRLVNIERDRIA